MVFDWDEMEEERHKKELERNAEKQTYLLNKQAKANERLRDIEEKQLAELQREREFRELAEAERWEQAQRIEDLQAERLGIEKVRLEEERERYAREELRSRLRAGLPNFSSASREKWRQIAEEWEASVEAERHFTKGADEVQKKHQAAVIFMESAAQALHRTVSPEFEEAVKSNRLGIDLKEFPETEAAFREYEQRIDNSLTLIEGYLNLSSYSATSKSSPNAWAGLLIQRSESILKGLSALKDTRMTASPGKGCGLGCVALVVMIVVGIMFAMVLPDGETFGTIWGVVTNLVVLAAFLYFTLSPIGKKPFARRIFAASNDLALGLSALSERAGSSSASQEIRSLPSDSSAISAMGETTIHNLSLSIDSVKQLLRHVFAWQGSKKLPEHSEFLNARSEVNEKTEEATAWLESWEEASEKRSEIEKAYLPLREQIEKVGKEIVEGIRVPGGNIELV